MHEGVAKSGVAASLCSMRASSQGTHHEATILHTPAPARDAAQARAASSEARAGAEAPARAQSPDRQAQPSTAALNHVVMDVGCVMAVPTMTAKAPASMAAAACSGV